MNLSSLIAGRPITGGGILEVRNPYDGSLTGTVQTATRRDVDLAVQQACEWNSPPTRFQRAEILEKAQAALALQREEFARLITRESGLALRESRYEVGRALDVLRFAAMEALRDDGQVFSGDTSPQGKARKIFSLREPLRCAAAITPFNHPLNQVAHKVAPAIAAGTPLVLKPSEKTPLTALRFADLLYAAGLPGPMLSVLLGPTSEVAEALVRHPDVEVLAFTGSEMVGKRIAATAGYKKLVLELGGNDPLIVLNDADLDLAVTLAAEGSYRNSGQRCTAVKRILVEDGIAAEFTGLLVEKTREYVCGDPQDEATRVGTVIDEAAARRLEGVVCEATLVGARVLSGGRRRGAQIEPTVIIDVPRECRMVTSESFGPLAPIITVRNLDDALSVANATTYGLSSGIVTENLQQAIKAVKQLRCGTVNINEVPGYRVECSPFGGIKDSGLGVKEGVIEAVKGLQLCKNLQPALVVMKTARCAIFNEPKKPMELAEMPLPQCGPRDVLVEISLSTICASDLHTFDGRRIEPCPSVLGHEGVGRVVTVGAGRDQKLLGQRVTWTIADSCGECVSCTDWDLPQKCSHLFKYGHSEITNGCGLNGCYATHILLRPGTTILPVPDELSDEMVAPANCALATMVGATEWLPKPCRVAVIQGAGMLGLCGCALLRAKGVKRVIVVDTDPARLELVESFGGIPALQTAGAVLPPGRADAVFEVAGTSTVVPEGIRHLRTGGYYAFIGMVHPTTPLELSGQIVLRHCLTLRGFHNYAPRHLEGAVQFLREHGRSLPWDRIVSPAFPLTEVNAAFDEARKRKWIRVSVRP